MTIRHTCIRFVDRMMAAQIVFILAGTTLAFGGAVWWVKPTLAVMMVCLATTSLIRLALIGRLVVLRSPLTAFGLLALGLAVVQIVPMPGRIASLISPNARAAHALGVLPQLAAADDPTFTLPEAVADRTSATIDRPATLRWIFGAIACLAFFCICSHYADRYQHSTRIWGSVVGVFFLGTTFAIAQLLGGSSGLYGVVEPGSGGVLAPSLADLASSPGSTKLGLVVESAGVGSPWVVQRPVRTFLVATMMGGVGSYLALAALGLPLAFGLTLHTLAPRGSREGLSARLRASHHSGLAIFLVILTAISTLLVGYLGGPILAIPYGLALVIVGVPASWSSGLKWTALGLTVVMLAGLASGASLGARLGRPNRAEAAMEAATWPAVRQAVSEATQAIRQFSLVGSGLGSYSTLSAYLKTSDATQTTARSSLLQWGIETGIFGMALLTGAVVWCLLRVPNALRRVGSGDKILAYMLIGTLGCFTFVSAIMSTVEILALALAACAVAGTGNRWLAGGTDLFVESA